MTTDRTPQQTLDRFRPRSAWDRFFPTHRTPWDARLVGHLHRRAGFGPDAGTLERDVAAGPEASLDALLNPDRRAVARFDAAADELEAGALDAGQVNELRATWVHRMLHSPDPLRERTTLFWHDHFATSQAKVNDPRAMAAHVATLRRHALGHFGDLLAAVLRDPALLLWLDADANRAGAANENLARELFELFALGPGAYTEADVQQAARALTGWTVTPPDRGGRRAVFDPARHDGGGKTVFGRTGRWGVGDLVRATLGHPACAPFVVRKLFRSFVSETAEPSDELLAPLADGFRLRDYDLRWLVETLLGSWVFHSDAAVRQSVKSPIDHAVGTARALGGSVGAIHVADAAATGGQSLLFPPNVAGWEGGTAWLTSSALIDRSNLAAEATSGAGNAVRLDPARLVGRHGVSGAGPVVDFFLDLFLQQPDHPDRGRLVGRAEAIGEAAGPFDPPGLVTARQSREIAEAVMLLPEYQLA